MKKGTFTYLATIILSLAFVGAVQAQGWHLNQGRQQIQQDWQQQQALAAQERQARAQEQMEYLQEQQDIRARAALVAPPQAQPLYTPYGSNGNAFMNGFQQGFGATRGWGR